MVVMEEAVRPLIHQVSWTIHKVRMRRSFRKTRVIAMLPVDRFDAKVETVGLSAVFQADGAGQDQGEGRVR